MSLRMLSNVAEALNNARAPEGVRMVDFGVQFGRRF
jgi:hypothetical protein